jgi:hypothetical protein
MEPCLEVLEFIKKNVRTMTMGFKIERTKFKPTPRETRIKGSLEKEESHNDGSNMFMDCFFACD